MSVTNKVFISFAQADDKRRRSLCRVLERQEPNFEPIVVVARRSPGKPLTDKVMESIREAQHFVAILTAESIQNQWVNQEIGYAMGIGRSALAVVDSSILADLRGFIHAQQDIPFLFAGTQNARRTSVEFRRACRLLHTHLASSSVWLFQSRIEPSVVRAGEEYTTVVDFKGAVRHGFFDNLVRHLESEFRRWNPDPETFVRQPGVDTGLTPGVLDGNVEVHREYSHRTKGWPRGRYQILVRLYTHLQPGVRGRQVVVEQEHELSVV